MSTDFCLNNCLKGGCREPVGDACVQKLLGWRFAKEAARWSMAVFTNPGHLPDEGSACLHCFSYTMCVTNSTWKFALSLSLSLSLWT